MVFHALTFARSRGIGQTLMYWLIMFDRCYCINSTKYLLKFWENMAHYTLSQFGSQRGEALFFFNVREH